MERASRRTPACPHPSLLLPTNASDALFAFVHWSLVSPAWVGNTGVLVRGESISPSLQCAALAPTPAAQPLAQVDFEKLLQASTQGLDDSLDLWRVFGTGLAQSSLLIVIWS